MLDLENLGIGFFCLMIISLCLCLDVMFVTTTNKIKNPQKQACIPTAGGTEDKLWGPCCRRLPQILKPGCVAFHMRIPHGPIGNILPAAGTFSLKPIQ